jgi:hypothetical protein
MTAMLVTSLRSAKKNLLSPVKLNATAIATKCIDKIYFCCDMYQRMDSASWVRIGVDAKNIYFDSLSLNRTRLNKVR